MKSAIAGVHLAMLPPLSPRLPHRQLHLLHQRIHPSSPQISPSPLPFSNSTRRPIPACSASISSSSGDIEMVRGRDGSYSSGEQKVVVLWDLDNKPPRGEPYDAAIALRRVAERFGRVVDVSAYANRHAFLHLPQWVLNNRRERRQLDALERKGLVVPDDLYVCGVCGRKCRTNVDLKRHFLQLHEREREKKLGRMRSLKGKKRQKYKERFISGNHKYTEAARELLSPKVGYGLASELRRAGVFVKTVEDKPQAADAAVKRQMQHSMSRGIDCILLVSDDSGFSEMIRKAREANLRTVVIGDGRRVLGSIADFWVPWMQVENGMLGEEVLTGRYSEFHEEQDIKEAHFSSSGAFYEDYDDSDGDWEDDDTDDFGAGKVSAFSEEEMWGGNSISGVFEATFASSSLSCSIEHEDDHYI